MIHFVGFLIVVLPDRSILIRQKMEENAKTEKLKCDILGVIAEKSGPI